MSEYTDGGSMRGSGIYMEWVSYDAFTCKNPECLHENQGGEAATNDWGIYEIECEKCHITYYEGDIKDDGDFDEDDWGWH